MTPEELQKIAQSATQGLDLSNFKGEVTAFKYVENEIGNVEKDGIGIQHNYYQNGSTAIRSLNTFAGNIGEMMYDSFFMNSTIGMFAEEKIKEIVRLSQKNCPTEEDKEKIKASSIIGDFIIRSLINEVEPIDNV